MEKELRVGGLVVTDGDDWKVLGIRVSGNRWEFNELGTKRGNR